MSAFIVDVLSIALTWGRRNSWRPGRRGGGRNTEGTTLKDLRVWGIFQTYVYVCVPLSNVQPV